MNFKEIKFIAFDIDGTLFSSEEIILGTYIEAIENFLKKNNKQNIIIPTKEKILEQVGLPVKTIFLNLLPDLNETERDEISDSVLTFLTNKIISKEGILYEGVIEITEYLKSKNYKLLAASNGRLKYIETILQTYSLIQYFEPILTIDYAEIKTKGEILKSYQKKYMLNSNEILMLGDRDSDFQAAKFISCPFAFCEYGHASIGEVNSFEISLKKILDLKNYL